MERLNCPRLVLPASSPLPGKVRGSRASPISTMATKLPRCLAAAAAATALAGTPSNTRKERSGQSPAPHKKQSQHELRRERSRVPSSGNISGGTFKPAVGRDSELSNGVWWALGGLQLSRVAHADAAAISVVEYEGGTSDGEQIASSVVEEEKPEFIQKADEQVRGMTDDTLHILVYTKSLASLVILVVRSYDSKKASSE